jgi:hypothetical protein
MSSCVTFSLDNIANLDYVAVKDLARLYMASHPDQPRMSLRMSRVSIIKELKKRLGVDDEDDDVNSLESLDTDVELKSRSDRRNYVGDDDSAYSASSQNSEVLT